MRHFAAKFGALNMDQPPNQLPSGTADIAENVEIDGYRLKGRRGFSASTIWTDATYPVALFIAAFSTGTTTLMAKGADGNLYGGATVVSDKWGGHGGGSGWGFMWADYFYYFDSAGGTKVGPGGTWKAGIDSTIGALLSAQAGRKEGYYHVHVIKRNSVTGATSRATDGSNVAQLSRLSAGDGGLTVTNVAAIKAADTDFEWDQLCFYCTQGHGEYIGLGSGAVCNTFKAYLDVLAPATASAIGLVKADHELDYNEVITNSGGTPPASSHGAFNGTRAVYLGLAEGGKMMMSLPRYPDMVPQDRYYTIGQKWFFAKPWSGVMGVSFCGDIVAVFPVGERFAVFTDTHLYWLMPLADGRVYPSNGQPGLGALCEAGVARTPFGAFVLSPGKLLRVSEEGIQDVAQYKFASLLDGMTWGALGYYSHRNEVWITNGQEIYIYNDTLKQLTAKFTPSGFETGEAFTCMIENPSGSGEPKMNLASTTGRLWTWPGSAHGDPDSSTYDCTWQGYFGQEFRAVDQSLARLRIHMGDNSTHGITVAIAGLRTSAEETAGVSEIVKEDTTPDGEGHIYAAATLVSELSPNRDGNLFRIKISSTNSGDTPQTPAWSIEDMVLSLDRVER